MNENERRRRRGERIEKLGRNCKSIEALNIEKGQYIAMGWDVL